MPPFLLPVVKYIRRLVEEKVESVFDVEESIEDLED